MRMTIGKKLITSYMGLSIFVLIAGFVGIVELNKVAKSTDTIAKKKAPIQYAVMNAAVSLAHLQGNLEKYINADSGLDDLEADIIDDFNDFDMWLSTIHHGTDSEEFINSSAGTLFKEKNLNTSVVMGSDDILALIDRIDEKNKTLRSNTENITKTQRTYNSYLVKSDNKIYPLPSFLNLAQRNHLEWVKQLKDAVNIETIFTGVTDHDKGTMGEWLSTAKVDNQDLAEIMAKTAKQHKKLCDLAVSINKEPEYKAKERLLRRGIGTTAKIEKYFNQMHEISGAIFQELIDSKKTALAELNNNANSINQDLNALIEKADLEMKSALQKSVDEKRSGQKFLLTITIAAVLIAAFLGFLITGVVSKPILKSVTGLISSANLVSNNASEVLSSSQTLADGAGEQAAAIEETTASMEEMSAMTRQNAENADQADNLMKTSVQIISIADTSMKDMSTSMEEISSASQETSKIVKTIDEIAFQTNLLALNAAVEAARAGEAGAGFAVVADEVRNLAMRAAEAAKNTSVLIESTVQKVNNGKNIVIKANEAFKEVEASSHKVGNLVAEIATASKEQAHGFEQINKAIIQMDSITQQNAAGAEESAAASEELNAQSAVMISLITNLQNVVDGGSTEINTADTNKDQQTNLKSVPARKQSQKIQSKPKSTHQDKLAPKQITASSSGDPAKIIPMDIDDDNFEDF